jgi:arsenite methyltransferase
MTSPDPRTADAVRADVSEQYTRAVTEGTGCCGPTPAAKATSCCSGPTSVVPKGTAAKLAGYDAEALAALPADAVTNSFGCGDPLAMALVKPGDTVLDLGSGAGIDLLLASKFAGPEGKVIGVDMTDVMIERARANIVEAGVDNVEVRKGVIEELPVDDSSVDIVISNCVINLSPDKPAVFSEISRVLQPGGRFSVSDIVAEDLPDWVRAIPDAYSACVSGAIPEADYVQGLRDAGLTDIEVVGRMVYDPDQVLALVESDMPGFAEKLKTLGITHEQIAAVLPTLEGKVASIKVTGRLPE